MRPATRKWAATRQSPLRTSRSSMSPRSSRVAHPTKASVRMSTDARRRSTRLARRSSRLPRLPASGAPSSHRPRRPRLASGRPLGCGHGSNSSRCIGSGRWICWRACARDFARREVMIAEPPQDEGSANDDQGVVDRPTALRQRLSMARPAQAATASERALTVVVMPFVLAYLAVRGAYRVTLRALGRLFLTIPLALERIALTVVRLAPAVMARVAEAIRAVVTTLRPWLSRAMVLLRGSATALRGIARPVAEVLRAVAHAVLEVRDRAVVVLKAIAHQVARPFRWLGHLIRELGGRVF